VTSSQSKGFFLCASLILTALICSCGTNSAVVTAPTIPSNSLHLSGQGTAYLQSESRLLTGFAVGVGNKRIANGSRTALMDGATEKSASEQVWLGDSLRTANGFNLHYVGAYVRTATHGRASGSGHLFIVNTGTAPTLTASRSDSTNELLLSARTGSGVALDAATGSDVVINVGSQDGGHLVLSGSQLTYTDSKGNIQAQHTFDAAEDVGNQVRGVLNTDVPPASDATVKLACKSGIPSVVNTNVFTVADFDASGSSQTIVTLTVVRDTFTDCLSGAVTVTVRVDASGDIDGHGFLAIAASPPVSDPVPPDNTPAPVAPSLTDFTSDPADASLVSLPVGADGQLPSYDGAYNGTFSGTQGTTQGTTEPAAGAMTFSVAGGSVVMSAPGTGSGSVDSGGVASFGFVISRNQASGGTGGSCQFTGYFDNSGGSKSAHGSMTCQGPGDSARATWTASA
jgi:hypothetical protein